ncbi:hypothetical protein ACKVEX_06470 [Rhodocyclaceae bacterium SMB388]
MRLKTFYSNGFAPLPLPTDAEIEIAKQECERLGLYGPVQACHEHPDCIRAAFAWLDAQQNTKRPGPGMAAKGVIEQWMNRYVSRTDVVVAAFLHPRIEGTYPYYNIRKRQIKPDTSRLAGLEVNIHRYPDQAGNYCGYETTPDRSRFPRLDVKAPTGGDTQAGAGGTDTQGNTTSLELNPARSIMPQRSSDGYVFLRPVRSIGGVR